MAAGRDGDLIGPESRSHAASDLRTTVILGRKVAWWPHACVTCRRRRRRATGRALDAPPGISTAPLTAAAGTQVRAKLARLAARPSRRRLLPGARAGQEDAGGDAQLPRYVLGDLRRRIGR